MKLKLYVMFCDSYSGYSNCMAGSRAPYPCRVVAIELTPEQVQQLTPRVVGHSGPVSIREDVHPLSIQSEE